ncbi:complex 1 protein containing protein expressed [Citrus sinensis]|nr:complex 1 protein containing protein expressed [Citrus sinensis]
MEVKFIGKKRTDGGLIGCPSAFSSGSCVNTSDMMDTSGSLRRKMGAEQLNSRQNCSPSQKPRERRARRRLTMQKWRRSLSILERRKDTVSLQRFVHNGPDTLEELLDRHLEKREKKKSLDDDEGEMLSRQRLTSTRREALSLYRDILRATRFFMWPDERGVLWRDILRESVRKEFEEARFEKDPEIVTRLLIGGRDAVQSALEKLAEKQRQQIDKEGGDRR